MCNQVYIRYEDGCENRQSAEGGRGTMVVKRGRVDKPFGTGVDISFGFKCEGERAGECRGWMKRENNMETDS